MAAERDEPPSATSPTYTLNDVRLSDSGSSFQCRVTNPLATTNSSLATLTVMADTTRPTATYAQNFGDPTLITLGFSEPLDPVSASTAGFYQVNNGVSVLAATLLADGVTVVLKTTPLTWGATYTVTIYNVKDQAQTPNTILPNSQRSFTLTYTPADVSQLTATNEPAGPSSRSTGLALTEILYHPLPRADGRNLEFIELYNSNPWPEDLTGYRLAGDVSFVFPAGTTIAARGYRVVAANPSDVQTVYGLSGVLGPLTNSASGNSTDALDNSGEQSSCGTNWARCCWRSPTMTKRPGPRRRMARDTRWFSRDRASANAIRAPGARATTSTGSPGRLRCSHRQSLAHRLDQ